LQPLRLLVAQTRADILAEALAEAIRRDSELVLCGAGVVGVEDIDRHLADPEQRPHAVILVGEAEQIDQRSLELVQRQPSLVILRLNIGSDVAQLDFRRVPLGELMAVVRCISFRRIVAAGQRVVQLRLHARSEADEGAPLHLVESEPARDAVFAAATRWIDAAIRRYLARRTRSDGDIPGLTVSPATIERDLAAGPQTDEPALEDAVESAARAFEQALDQMHSSSSLATLGRELRLSRIEMQMLLLGFAPELDQKYQRIFGYLQDDMSRRSASFGLACALLGDCVSIRGRLAANNTLGRWRLLGFGADGAIRAEELLRFDSSVAAWLLGGAASLVRDVRVARLLRTRRWHGQLAIARRSDLDLAQRLAVLLARDTADSDWLILCGEDLPGWRALIESAATQAALPLLRVDFRALHSCGAAEIDETVTCLVRAALLMDAIIVVDFGGQAGDARGEEAVLEQLAQRCSGRIRRQVVITSRHAQALDALGNAPCHVLTRTAPDAGGRQRMFAAAARRVGLPLESSAAARLASLYRFSVDSIERVAHLAVATSNERTPEAAAQSLANACRRVATTELPRLARRLDPCFSIGDVVLPDDRRAQLNDLVAHVVNADLVLDTWGFKHQLPYGRGVAALFSGPSGTGKTMAAQAIARELRAELYVVDIARVVSKYIGETEKNLEAVFSEAEQAGAVLLFDEADALFGRRSEVKDAHDRYANIEVAYLLQRMEMYTGIAILTTNLRQNVDPAFLRRLRFIVDFPKPDAAARELIWQQCLTAAAPKEPDLDFRFIARRVDVTGGNIRQITLRAAFAAAAEGKPIGMHHIVGATRAELRKLGLSDADLEMAA
jgi:hypothetical protein